MGENNNPLWEYWVIRGPNVLPLYRASLTLKVLNMGEISLKEDCMCSPSQWDPLGPTLITATPLTLSSSHDLA